MALNLLISGRVQGVGYRAWAVRQARALALSGWVRNRLDGTVEIAVLGDAAAVESFVALCRRGPPAAHVNGVAKSEQRAEDLPYPFAERPTV